MKSKIHFETAKNQRILVKFLILTFVLCPKCIVQPNPNWVLLYWC
jgi:hypothetical protein